MNISTIVIGLGVLAVLTAIVIREIRNRRQGNCSCGGSCTGCPGCCQK